MDQWLWRKAEHKQQIVSYMYDCSVLQRLMLCLRCATDKNDDSDLTKTMLCNSQCPSRNNFIVYLVLLQGVYTYDVDLSSQYIIFALLTYFIKYYCKSQF